MVGRCSRPVPLLLLSLMLLGSNVACGQGRQFPPADRASLRITRSIVLRGLASCDKSEITANFLFELDDEPIDSISARLLVSTYGGYPSTLKAAADVWNTCAKVETDILTEMEKDVQYLSNAVTVAVAAADVRNRSRDSIDAVESKANEQLTSELAIQVVKTASLLPNLRSKEFSEVVARFRGAVRAKLETNPDQLKPFLAERTVPDQLRRSRARVRALLDEARKAK